MHPETGELWETDNGPQGGDEINIIKRGLNYGWPVVTYGRAYTSDPEGIRSPVLRRPTVQPPTSAPGMEEPVTFYKPSIAISGMAFYTGRQVSTVEREPPRRRARRNAVVTDCVQRTGAGKPPRDDAARAAPADSRREAGTRRIPVPDDRHARTARS